MSIEEEDPAPPRRKRRSWTLEEKRRIVDESLEDGASIAEIARLHDLNANQLFTWRRQFGVEPAEPNDLAPILPVTIALPAREEETGSRTPSPISPLAMEAVRRIDVLFDIERAINGLDAAQRKSLARASQMRGRFHEESKPISHRRWCFPQRVRSLAKSVLSVIPT